MSDKFQTNNQELVTLPVDMIGNAHFYIVLDRNEKILKIYKRSNNFDLVNKFYPIDKNFNIKNDIPFVIYDKIPCIIGGDGSSQTPRGIFKIQMVSQKHKEYTSSFHPSGSKVKMYGYIQFYEYYWIHSNMYIGDDVNQSNFMNKSKNICDNGNFDGNEHTMGCIRIPDQCKLDEIMEYICPGDIINTY